MTIDMETRKSITEEYNQFVSVMYAGKDKKERQKLGQFFTPPELTIRMIEKFDDMSGTILDPTCGCGGLLAACIIAGADPKKCYGIEIDEDILRLAKDRLGKLGVPENNLHQGDALSMLAYDFR